MDIDGWEILSDDRFHDFNKDDADENHIFLGKKKNESKSDFDNNICTMVPSTTTTEKINGSQIGAIVEDDEDTVSPNFFKMNENEFVPKSNSSRVMFTPPVDVDDLKFEDKGEAIEEVMNSPRKKVESEMIRMKCEKEEDGFNLWKWGLSGIGVVAAAVTICVLFYGSKHKNKLQQHHKIQFQIYTDDKRIKQVVQHATKLNESISVAARGVPLSRAHITYGGYYNGL